jgi:nitrogen fixation NifU-like protein
MNSDLYKTIILDHNKNPRNYGRLGSFTHKLNAENSNCGDSVWIYLRVDEKNIIRDISFECSSCALCKASTSIMGEYVKGKSYDDMVGFSKKIISDFFFRESEDLTPDLKEEFKNFEVFENVWRFSSRAKCAALAWEALATSQTKKSLAYD